MTDYEMLIDYKRMIDERDMLLEKLGRLRTRRIICRNRREQPEFYLEEKDADGERHSKKIDGRLYSDLYENNYEVKYFTERISELNALISKYQAKIPECERHIISLYEQQKKLAAIKNANCEMKNTASLAQGKIYFRTERGEWVRSKAEEDIADKLFAFLIFYIYEWHLPGTNLFPDFYIKDNIRQTPIIWEHFGMMDNPDYVQRYLRKIEIYKKHGFIPGKNLITTFEFYSENNPESRITLDTQTILSLIREYFLPEGIIAPKP